MTVLLLWCYLHRCGGALGVGVLLQLPPGAVCAAEAVLHPPQWQLAGGHSRRQQPAQQLDSQPRLHTEAGTQGSVQVRSTHSHVVIACWMFEISTCHTARSHISHSVCITHAQDNTHTQRQLEAQPAPWSHDWPVSTQTALSSSSGNTSRRLSAAAAAAPTLTAAVSAPVPLLAAAPQLEATAAAGQLPHNAQAAPAARGRLCAHAKLSGGVGAARWCAAAADTLHLQPWCKGQLQSVRHNSTPWRQQLQL